MELPRLSPIEAVILDLLTSRGEMYGLELVNGSEGRLKRGTVYVTLSRMGDKGFVESRPEKRPSSPGLPRRLYRPTGYGASVLHAQRRWREAVTLALAGVEQ